jgi:hypothetical protein
MKYLKLFESFNVDGKVDAANMMWFTFLTVRKISKLKKIVDEEGNHYYYIEMDKYKKERFQILPVGRHEHYPQQEIRQRSQHHRCAWHQLEWKNKFYKLILFHRRDLKSELDFDAGYIYGYFNYVNVSGSNDKAQQIINHVLKKIFKRDCDSGFRHKNIDYFKELIKMKYRDL